MSEALNRQYHELLGWKRTDRPLVSASDWYPGFAGEEFWRVPGGGEIRDRLPNLHEDADLCIAELDRVFQDWYVRVEHIDDPASEFYGKKTILVTGENFNREKDDWEPSCSGHSVGNFTEAALRALIAAHKRESEAV